MEKLKVRGWLLGIAAIALVVLGAYLGSCGLFEKEVATEPTATEEAE